MTSTADPTSPAAAAESTTNEPSAEAIAALITQSAPPPDTLKRTPSANADPPQPSPAAADGHAARAHPHATAVPEEPATASREGTYHTIATTADQTLVDTNDSSTHVASDHLKPLAAPPADPLLVPTSSDPMSHTTTPTDTTPAASKPSAPATTTTTTPTSPSPRPAPASNPPVSQAGPSATAPPPAGRQAKTPTRKKLIRFLLPCFHPTAHDEHSTTVSKFARRPSQEAPAREMAERAGASAAAAGTSGSLQPSSGTTTRRSPIVLAKQHLRKGKPANASPRSSTNLARRSPSSQCMPTPVSDTVTPAGAAAATSAANAHGGAGVQVPMAETEGMLSGAVVPPGKDTVALRKSASALRLGARNQAEPLVSSSAPLLPADKTESDEASMGPDDPQGYQDIEDSEDDEEDRIVAMGGMGIPRAPNGSPRPLLAPLDASLLGRKCLVLDLDETLVHSSFKVIPQSDFVVPVEIENSVHNVHVIKRPGVDEFMRKMGEIYEVVVFTASLSKYADPVLDMLDIHHVVKHRLFRESCYNHKGNYVKDLSQLGRPIADTIIIDNSPASYVFHPNNAVPVSSWFNDPHDTELTDLAAFLTDIANVPDVRGILDPRL